MTTILEFHQLQTHLEEYLVRVIAGEEFIIVENGKAIARLLSCDGNHITRYPGSASGMIHYSEDCTNPLPDGVIADFEQ